MHLSTIALSKRRSGLWLCVVWILDLAGGRNPFMNVFLWMSRCGNPKLARRSSEPIGWLCSALCLSTARVFEAVGFQNTTTRQKIFHAWISFRCSVVRSHTLALCIWPVVYTARPLKHFLNTFFYFMGKCVSVQLYNYWSKYDLIHYNVKREFYYPSVNFFSYIQYPLFLT